MQEVLEQLGIQAADSITTVSWAVLLHVDSLRELIHDFALESFDNWLVCGVLKLSGWVCQVTLHGGKEGICISSVLVLLVMPASGLLGLYKFLTVHVASFGDVITLDLVRRVIKGDVTVLPIGRLLVLSMELGDLVDEAQSEATGGFSK